MFKALFSFLRQTSPLLVAMSLYFPTKAQTIWLSPQSGTNAVPDLMDLFQPEAPWANAAAHVSVFSVSAEFLVHRPDSTLQQLFANLRQRHIQLGVAMSPLSARPTPEAPECGVGVESYSAPGEALMIARKVRRLGGAIDYYTMDEPLYYGHVYGQDPKGNTNSKHCGCRLSIREIAQDAAKRIADVHSVFPAAIIGDVEPFMQWEDGQWEQDVREWCDAFQAATGQRLAYFRLDLWWNLPWQKRMARLASLLHEKQVPLQVIYDGASFAPSDRAWIDQAAQRFREFEGTAGLTPDAVIMQSWHSKPSHELPESDPGTLTNLVLQYIAWKRARGQSISH
jgi:hypothetical protein